MKTRKLALFAATAVSMVYVTANKAYAQCFGSSCLGGIQGTQGDLLAFVTDSLNLIIGLAALIAVGFLIYSGVQYILAAGDEGKVEKATKGIVYAIVGLIICFISVLIVNFVLTAFLGQ